MIAFTNVLARFIYLFIGVNQSAQTMLTVRISMFMFEGKRCRHNSYIITFIEQRCARTTVIMESVQMRFTSRTTLIIEHWHIARLRNP